MGDRLTLSFDTYIITWPYSSMSSLGCVLLDVSGDDFPSIVDTIVQNLVQSKLLPMKDFDQVKKLLLKKHKHTKGTTIWEKLKHSAAGEQTRVGGREGGSVLGWYV